MMVAIKAIDISIIFWAKSKIVLVYAKVIDILPQFLPETGQEEIAPLQYWSIDRRVTCAQQESTQSISHPTLLLVCLWQEIMHAPQSLDALPHKNTNLLFNELSFGRSKGNKKPSPRSTRVRLIISFNNSRRCEKSQSFVTACRSL